MNEWNVIDLHTHTVSGFTRDKTRDNVDFSYVDFCNVLKKYNIKLMAVTNHNYVDFVNYVLMRFLSKLNNTNILMGVELDSTLEMGDHVHIACIFNENFFMNYNAHKEINRIVDYKMKKEKEIAFNNCEIIDLLRTYDVIMIPHGEKDKGFFKDASPEKIDEALKKIREGFIRIFDFPSDWKVERLKSRLNSLDISDFDEFGGVLFSDNRDWKNYDKCFKDFCMNAEPTFKGLLHSITNPTKRFKTRKNIQFKNNYISKIVINGNDSRIASSVINLSYGYNCVIGKSGSGKSLLLYLIQKKLIKDLPEENNYSFSKNITLELYNERNEILSNNNINLGIGANLFDKIIAANSSDNYDDYYKVISLLKPDFIKKEKFNSFKNEYNTRINNYCLLSEMINSNNESIISKIIKYNSDVLLLNMLKEISTFEVCEVENQFDCKYDKKLFDEYNTYNSIMSQLDKVVSIYKGCYKDKIDSLLKELKNYLLVASKDINNELNIYNLSNKKVSIINNAIKTINSNKSKQAETKSKLLSSLPIQRKEIIALILDNYKKIRRKNNYDLSINKKMYNSEKIVNKKSNIVVRELISDDIICNLNEKDNSVFNTYGKMKLLDSSHIYNLSNKDSAKALIDTYIKTGVISSNHEALNSNFDVCVQVLFDGQDITQLNPGTIAKTYIDLYFDEQVNNGDNDVVLFDQIENDVDKEFINDVVRNLIEKTKGNVQTIIVTHDPIVAVNADPNKYIYCTRNSDDIIEYRDFVAESSICDELNTIACTVDGSKDVIKSRYDIYEGEKEYEYKNI